YSTFHFEFLNSIMESVTPSNSLESGFASMPNNAHFKSATSRSRCIDEVRGSPPIRSKKAKQRSLGRMNPFLNHRLIHEALGFIVRSAQVRGYDSNLLCSRVRR